jgi:hypothetical protein
VTPPLKRGDFVTLTIGTWTCDAMVGIASENGQSIAVLFDGAAPVGNGYAMGMLMLSEQDDTDDGTYTSLIGGDVVNVWRKPRA